MTEQQDGSSDSKAVETDVAVAFYQRMLGAVVGRRGRDAKRRAAKAERANSQPFQPGRDPISAVDSVNALLSQFAWDAQISEAELFANWGEIVGEGNAANSKPEQLANGLLVVRCVSTTWATSLRLMEHEILQRIRSKHADLGVEKLKFLGPDAPSWKKGPRSVPGRGPRDTYG